MTTSYLGKQPLVSVRGRQYRTCGPDSINCLALKSCAERNTDQKLSSHVACLPSNTKLLAPTSPHPVLLQHPWSSDAYNIGISNMQKRP